MPNAEMMVALRKICGTAQVAIEFSGGGDQGQIDTIEVTGLLDTAALQKMPVPDDVLAGYMEITVEELLKADTKPSWAKNMYELLEEWVYSRLLQGSIDFDWINNDGGRGTVIIEPFSGVIRIEAEEYFQDSREHSYDLSLDKEELDAIAEPANG